MNYLLRAMELKGETVANRRFLHQNPETGFDLPVTCKFVTDKLTEMGYTPAACGRSGITATVGNKEGGKVILLRADMDALPMHEESGLPFASTIDKAHACGHDMHTSMLLCAAKMLKESENELEGTVKLMFQPAEEILEGAKSMIEAGILENPGVNAAIGLHMLPQAPTGLIIYNIGAVTSYSDALNITITGKGGHGSLPNTTIDPINVAAHLHIALQEIISREIDPEEFGVLTFGMIETGEAHNIIPETAIMHGTMRSFDKEIRDFMLTRITEMTEHTSKNFRAEGAFEVFASTGALVVDKYIAEEVCHAYEEMFGPEVVRKLERRASGSEDFAEISQRVPSFFFALGAGSEMEGYEYGLHNPAVRFNEDALPIGAAAYAEGAAAWLRDNRVRLSGLNHRQ